MENETSRKLSEMLEKRDGSLKISEEQWEFPQRVKTHNKEMFKLKTSINTIKKHNTELRG